ncbi:hypothetical protein A3731_10590 [Roseovarius sp. HI0049]|nr:hypothetical protein A3731_10590 [Roseovarius sp. HI0049]
MADSEGLQQVRLTPGDEAEAMALSREAGWNQLPGDWRHFIEEGQTLGLRDRSGRLVATGAALPYDGPFGFVSMVIVSETMRRRGLATSLVEECTRHLRQLGLVPILDATEQGQPVYERQGFLPQFRYDRWEIAGDGPAPVNAPAFPAGPEDIARLDSGAFGARRPALLTAFLSRPDTIVVSEGTSGFALLRRGSRAWQAGPVISDTEDAALRLLGRLPIGAVPLFIDVPQRWRKIGAWLKAQGFAIQRSFARMGLHRQAPFGRPDTLFATAGPEFG